MENNMENNKSTFRPKQQKRSKAAAVSCTGKFGGGGGIGGVLGITIFLGGAVATAAAAAAFLLGWRLRKSTCSSNTKNCNHHDHSTRTSAAAEIEYKLLEDMNMKSTTSTTHQADSLNPDPPASTTNTTHQSLRSNGTAESSITHENDIAVISDHTFFQDEMKYKVEANGGKGDPISDGREQLVHPISSNGLVSSLQFDTSPVEEEESPFPLNRNQTLLHPKHMADRLSIEENQMNIQEDDSIDTALVDQVTEKQKTKLENVNGEEIKINCCPDQDIRQWNIQEAAEKTKEETSGEEQECPFHSGQESESPGNLSPTNDQRPEIEESSSAFQTVQVIGKVEVLDAAVAGKVEGDTKTQMTVVHCSPNAEHFGAKSGNEKIEASDDDLGKGHIPIILMLAEQENECHHRDRSLNIEANQETEGNKTLEASNLDEHRGLARSMSEEGQMICLVGSPTNEAVAAEVKEKIETMEGAEARDTEDISCEESLANEEIAKLPRDQQKPHTEELGALLDVDHVDGSRENPGPTVTNMYSAEVKSPEQLKHQIGSYGGFTEIEVSAGATEAREENVVPEQTTKDRIIKLEPENSPMQLDEEQQNPSAGNQKQLEEVQCPSQANYADNVTIEEHNVNGPEEDRASLNDEGDEDAEGANTSGKVEASSKGTGDSSAESTAEPIWPIESEEDVSMEEGHMEVGQKLTQVPTYPLNIENDGIIDNSFRKGDDRKINSILTPFQRVMVELAELTHQPTHSQKLRILIPTILALSLWSLCFWQFGQAFLKISVILILIKVLSKIQGF